MTLLHVTHKSGLDLAALLAARKAYYANLVTSERRGTVAEKHARALETAGLVYLTRLGKYDPSRPVAEQLPEAFATEVVKK